MKNFILLLAFIASTLLYSDETNKTNKLSEAKKTSEPSETIKPVPAIESSTEFLKKIIKNYPTYKKGYFYFQISGKNSGKSFSYLGTLKVIQKKSPYVMLELKVIIFKSIVFRFEVKDGFIMQEHIPSRKKKVFKLNQFTFIEILKLNLPFEFITEILQGMLPNQIFYQNAKVDTINQTISFEENKQKYLLTFQSYQLSQIKIEGKKTLMLTVQNKMSKQKRIYPSKITIKNTSKSSSANLDITINHVRFY